MAIYHLSAQVLSRSQGRSSVAAAAYRAAEILYDERLGKTMDFEDKTGVEHKEILAPKGAPAWVQDREKLWNAVEKAEKRVDVQVAREVRLALPKELSKDAQLELVRGYVQSQFVDRGMVADFAIHRDDPGNPHVHVMLTMRSIDENGFGKKVRDWNSTALLQTWREGWAVEANFALERAGHDVRIDHRSYADQGLAIEPGVKVGSSHAIVEKDGREIIRERLQEQLEVMRRNGEAIIQDPNIALHAVTHQRATFTQADVSRWLATKTVDNLQRETALEAVMGSAWVVPLGEDARGLQRFTTQEMVLAERLMLETSEKMAGQKDHMVSAKILEQVEAKRTLTEEQRAVLRFVTSGSGDLAVVEGYAGTGKSYVLGAAREAWEGEGYRVLGGALAGKAAEGLEASAGIPSRSLASWEYAWTKGRDQLSAKDILVVDEAGMVGTRQMERVVREVNRAGAKLVLVGDSEQLQAIEAGAAFRGIGGVTGQITLSEIRRQESETHRKATRDFAEGRVDQALAAYAKERRVHSHNSNLEARRAMIDAWDANRKAHPEETQVMLAYKKDDVRALNEEARAIRQTGGELGEDQKVQTERGERMFATGDRVVFLKNDRELGVKNGTLGTATCVDGSHFTVETDDGRKVAFSAHVYPHIDHGYAATVHKAQGMTIDRAQVFASGNFDRHAAYVAMSRHRKEVDLHVSREEFATPDAFQRTFARARPKDLAVDYVEALEVKGTRGPIGIRPGAEYKPEEKAFAQMPHAEVLKTREAMVKAARSEPMRAEDAFQALPPVREARQALAAAEYAYKTNARMFADYEKAHPVKAAIAKRGVGEYAAIYDAAGKAAAAEGQARARLDALAKDPKLRGEAERVAQAHNDRRVSAQKDLKTIEPFYQRAVYVRDAQLNLRAQEIKRERELQRSLGYDRGR